MYNRKHTRGIVFALIASMIVSNVSCASAKQERQLKDVHQLIVKDQKEVNKTEDGTEKYIVLSDENSGKLQKKYHLNVEHENGNIDRYSKESFTVADVSAKQVETMKADGIKVEKDYLLQGSDATEDVWQKSMDEVVEGAWDIKAIRAENTKVKTQKCVKVAVLDSGMDKFSAGCLAGAVNFVSPEQDELGVDATGHGTSVENIILSDGDTTKSVIQNKKMLDLYSVKVLDENNQAPISRIVAAINWCIDNDIDIINMSFGTLVHSQALADTIKKAADAEILMIAAAGNGGEASESTVEYPAAYPEVMGIGSTDQKMQVSSFSARGEEIDLVAPGENIPVAMPWGFYGLNSGTSYAAPHVTAVAALLWAQNKDKTAEQIRDILCESANNACAEEKAGNGLLDYACAKKIASQSDLTRKCHAKNEVTLKEYAVPEIVQASWNQKGDESNKDYMKFTHKGQVGVVGGTTSIDAEKLKYLCTVVEKADAVDSLAKYRVLHSGCYQDTENNMMNFTNYVAAVRCLYNAAYLLKHQNSSRAQLKAYIDKHYTSYHQTDGAIKKAKNHLKALIDVALDNKLNIKTSNKIDAKEKKILCLVGFALHAASDAFSHQYVINPKLVSKIYNNTLLTKINFDPITNKLTFKFSKNLLDYKSNKYVCTTKILEYLVPASQQASCHQDYADNVSFVYARYDIGSKYAVTQMIKLYVNSVKKFDPRVFINDSYTGSGTEGRIPLFELRTNIIDAGYTVSSCSSAKISANKIDTALKNLSSW